MRPMKSEPSNNLNFSAIYKGVISTLLISLVLSMFFGTVYYLTNLSENSLPWVSSGILCLSVLVGGGYAAAKAGAKGLYHGIGVAVIYFILVWLVAALFLQSFVTFSGFAIKLILTLLSGALGGILGVSLKA